MTEPPTGRPAADLSDEELADQGRQLHDSRNWVFLHGSAAQFERHTARMLELEQEYLARFPRRTWQGLQKDPDGEEDAVEAVADPGLALLQRLAEAPAGRLHKLEVHQLARRLGLDRAALARLYTADPPLLGTDREDRVLTDEGRRAVEEGSLS